jgi:L-glutamine-phosphate cytidylyltransferase
MSVRVIIPAAGLGQRLRPYTQDLPKCLLPIGGVPLIERVLGQLRRAGADHVVCVVGHHADLVERHVGSLRHRPPVSFVRNPHYATTNSIVSLHLTADGWDDGLAVVDSDILVADRLIDLLLSGTGTAMVIDSERTREEIDMAVELRDGAVWHLDKELPRERAHGEFFGLSRWSPQGAAELRAEIGRMVAAGHTGVWYQFAIREVAKRMRIAPLTAHRDEWTELDRAEDLAAARTAYAAGAAWAGV